MEEKSCKNDDDRGSEVDELEGAIATASDVDTAMEVGYDDT